MSARKAKKVNKLLTYISAIFVILILVVVAWYFVPGIMTADEEPHFLSEEFYGEETDPVISNLQQLERRGASRDEVLRSLPLPGHMALEIYSQDITSDEASEHIIMRTNPELPSLHRRLARDGYVGQVEGMIIYKNMNGNLEPVLTMTPTSMRNAKGEQLIGQIEAKFGYAVKITDYENEQYYSSPVKIITIVITDEDGRAASDELTIYWDPGPKTYKATNTFGAPGTFASDS